MNQFIRLVSLSILFFYTGCRQTTTPIQLAPLFGDHMVLQQKDKAPIWGKAQPGVQLTVTGTWGATATTTVSPSGEWMVRLKTPTFGGPYAISINASTEQLTINDVLIGEVWVTSGQSNMEWPMWARINNQKEEVKAAVYPDIRVYSVPRKLEKSDNTEASWKRTTPENAVDFTAVGYFFARNLYQELNIPIGIINSSWGGTRVEAWSSLEQLGSTAVTAEKVKDLIAMEGGREALMQKLKSENKQIQQDNEAHLQAKGYPFPQNIKQWKELTLSDAAYYQVNYDDKDWQTIQLDGGNTFLTYDKLFEAGRLSDDGVVWFRHSFDVSDPDLQYKLVTTGGIDDYDYTYINGMPIGIGLACCYNRSYDIPKGILKKTGNTLAVRVVDMGGEGGFKGKVFLQTNQHKQRLDTGVWKFKHTAFQMNTYFQTHTLTYDELKSTPALFEKKLKKTNPINNPNAYGVLFDYMIAPLVPYAIKGVLWYQGESNVPNANEYQELFTAMIKDWRQKWTRQLPFYFVQIAPYKYTDSDASQRLREAQRKSLALENTGMAITMDIGEENDIHPANKQDVGARLARLALVNTYGVRERVATGPLYKSKTLSSNAIDLSFDFVGAGLMGKNGLKGFEIAGSNQKFFPAKATIKGNKVRVQSSRVKNPQRVRYGWKNYFEATLFNREGLPASSFDTE